MGGAERAAEIAERAIKMLNKAVCKNEHEGHLIDKELFHMHQRTCLMYRFVSQLNLDNSRNDKFKYRKTCFDF